ncbi:hypothetical protein FJT64_023270 [Amphibalanus amphitrite]|uniref:Uncharacterized protein n=1 Tax=Amphibalanus amphitrite TaxID=1232801 RepID=A0A6A4WEA9_AMPAM|nr:hypothetical protein FJT64_023270 [Amphibalanus amphitrite]
MLQAGHLISSLPGNKPVTPPMMTSLGQALSLCLRVTFAIVLVAILANMAYGLYVGFTDFYRSDELKVIV